MDFFFFITTHLEKDKEKIEEKMGVQNGRFITMIMYVEYMFTQCRGKKVLYMNQEKYF